MTHPHSKRTVVPTAVLTRSRLVSLNAAGPVATAITQSTVKCTRTVKNVFNKAHSPVMRPINQRTVTKNSNFNKKFTNIKVNKVNVVQGNKGNAKKASACWVWKSKFKVLDHVSKLTSTSMTFKKFDYTDAPGRSKSSLKKSMEDMLHLEGILKVGNPQHASKDNGVIDSRCSRHVTGNMSYLSDFKELNSGYVAFGEYPTRNSLSTFPSNFPKESK
nr:hypothetical protein [Tanacetum cinerariifolium]